MSNLRIRPFERKAYGRIFVGQESHVQLVNDILDQLDSEEVSGYMPPDLVTVYDFGGWNSLVYTHKFEIDKTAVERACFKSGIPIWILDGYRDSHLDEKPRTL